MTQSFKIHSDISIAETLPSSFYRDSKIFEKIRNDIFLKSWQFIGDDSQIKLNNSFMPYTILDGFLTEPVIVTRDDESKVHCLTNVCTHRGNIIVLGPGKSKKLTCCYHGRAFDLKGNFKSMPEFEETKNFPSKNDNLHRFPLEKWGSFLFAGLNPSSTNVIDYITISTTGNATDFGDVSAAMYSSGAVSSKTRAVMMGGYVAPATVSYTHLTLPTKA